MAILWVLVIGVLALAFGAFALPFLQNDPGYILISVGPWTVEMRFWFAVALILVTAFLIYGLIKCLGALRRFARARWDWAWNSRHAKAQQLLDNGIAKFVVEDYQAAYLCFKRSAKTPETAYLSYLLSAKTLAKLGESQKAVDTLENAAAQRHANLKEIELLKAEVLYQDNQFESCLAVLNRLKTKQAKNALVLSWLKKTYWAMGDWQALLILAEDMRLAKVLNKSELDAFIYSVYLAQLQTMLNKSQQIGSNVLEAPFVSELRVLWEEIPSRYKSEEALTLTYARLLFVTKQLEALEKICREYLAHKWSSEMVKLYGMSESGNISQQIQVAEQWLKQHDSDGNLHYALGKLYAKNNLWGQAKTHFQKALDIQPSSEVYLDLGRLAAQVGEEGKQKALYEQGLALKN